MKKMKFVAQCFFCEKDIAKKGQDPVSLSAVGAKKVDGREPHQMFWCHCKCLALRVGDPYSLNPDFGGKEMDLMKMRVLKEEELPKWLRKKSSTRAIL